MPVILWTVLALGLAFIAVLIAARHTRTIVPPLDLPPGERQDFIWDKIIYANPTKPTDTLEELNRYKPLVTFDNLEEIHKIKREFLRRSRDY